MAPREVEVDSVFDLEVAAGGEDRSEDLNFVVKDSTSLVEADRLWRYVSTTGGYGTLHNIEVLRGKHEARLFVEEKLDRLRGWANNIDEEISRLNNHMSLLQAGGASVRPGYEPIMLEGPIAYFDLEERADPPRRRPEVWTEKLRHEKHIKEIMSQYTEQSPYLGRDGRYWTDGACQARELKERQALHGFRVACVQAQVRSLNKLKTRILERLKDLELQFLHEPTDLGCGNAEYVTFFDTAVHLGEGGRSDTDDFDI